MPVSPRLSLLAAIMLTSLAGCGSSGVPIVEPSSQRSLPAGNLVGFQSDYGSHAWLGIPFAQPPVGELRWRAPLPLAAWEGRLEALELGAPCTQLANPLSGVADAEIGSPVGSEDCLTLSVWAPPFAEDAVPQGLERLPVFVWIHGGGNRIGWAGFYDGGNLAAQEDLIVVMLQYRLGPLGWFRHASLRGEGTSARDRSGNYGTLDLVRGLEWVQENIASFGGDPDNVTIAGESAGGRNVLTMMMSPLANGLFHRAIIQSGGTYSTDVTVAEAFAGGVGHEYSSNEILLELLQNDGTADSRDAARQQLEAMDDPEVSAYLRDIHPYELLAAYATDPTEGLGNFPQVFRDGYVLPRQEFLQRIARGAYHQVPVIVGNTRDEDKVFMAFTPEWSTLRLGFAPRPRDPERFALSAEYRSRGTIARNTTQLAGSLRSAQGSNVYAYRFDWDEEPSIPFVTDLSFTLGASHGFEIPFMFGHWNLGPNSGFLFLGNGKGRKLLSKQMMSYWSQFAYAGEPSTGRDGSLPEWSAWDASSPTAARFIVLDTPDGGGLRMSHEAEDTQQLLSSVATDPRLTTSLDRCRILWELSHHAGLMGRDDYAANVECGEFPYAAYPWDGSEHVAAAQSGD